MRGCDDGKMKDMKGRASILIVLAFKSHNVPTFNRTHNFNVNYNRQEAHNFEGHNGAISVPKLIRNKPPQALQGLHKP